MTSEEQKKANFLNALLSTGPKTPEGKATVKMNAQKHGFAGQTVVIPHHEVATYKKHFASFRAEYQPVGPTEEFLVQSLAELSFSVQQIRAATTNRIYLAGARPVKNTHESHTPDTNNAMSQAFSAMEFANMHATYSIYEQRKMRLFHSTRKELMAIQAERKLNEKAELIEAAQLREADKKNRQPHEKEWHPSENGFVCSLTEIDRYIHSQNRRNALLHPGERAA